MTVPTATLATTATRPTLPAGAPVGVRVVRSRFRDDDGQHRWALAVHLTSLNAVEVAAYAGLDLRLSTEVVTGVTTAVVVDADGARVGEGDWLVRVGAGWRAVRDRDMTSAFTSTRGGVLSGR